MTWISRQFKYSTSIRIQSKTDTAGFSSPHEQNRVEVVASVRLDWNVAFNLIAFSFTVGFKSAVVFRVEQTKTRPADQLTLQSLNTLNCGEENKSVLGLFLRPSSLSTQTFSSKLIVQQRVSCPLQENVERLKSLWVSEDDVKSTCDCAYASCHNSWLHPECIDPGCQLQVPFHGFIDQLVLTLLFIREVVKY